MARAIVAGAVYRPSYRAGGLSVEAPDEDAFTLAVAAAERLLDRPNSAGGPIDGIHLVGDFPPEADAGFPEVLGALPVAVERHGHGAAGLGAALRAAARPESDGVSLVLAADVARDASADGAAYGAAGVALELRPGVGLVPTGHGGRRHPTHRTPDANAWVADGVRHSGLPATGATGTLFFVAGESPPVLLAFWRRAQPSMPIVPGSPSPTGVGPAPSVAAALWTLELARRTDGGEWGVLARVTSEETQFLGFRRTGSVDVADDPASGEGDAGLGPAPRRVPDEARRAVSEGAYVPHPRYIENLPSRWRLLAERCGGCSAVTFPIRGRCRACGRSDALTTEALPRRGSVLAATVVAPGAHPTEFDPLVAVAGAYGVVLAEMGPGVRATLQVADHGPEPLAPGSPVRTALRRLYPMEGEWRYGRKALAERAR